MPVLSKRIVLDCFYLLIFYFEKFSTAVCRLPCAVNVNLNLSIVTDCPLRTDRTRYRKSCKEIYIGNNASQEIFADSTKEISNLVLCTEIFCFSYK